MLKRKVCGISGDMPADLSGSCPKVGRIETAEAANAASFGAQQRLARRLRREQRMMRSAARISGGWSVTLW